jgi:putative flippase GtrA
MTSRRDTKRTVAKREIVERTVDWFVPRRLLAHRERLQYLAVGGWNSLFGYTVFAILFWTFGAALPYRAILTVSYVIGVANNYVTYRVVVFRSHDRVVREAPRFIVAYLPTLVVSLIALPAARHSLHINVYVLQAAFMLLVLLVTYPAQKYFGFRHAGRQSGKT